MLIPISARTLETEQKNSAAGKPLIEFRGVYKAYDNGTKALNDVNLQIQKGEFVFIVGASGAGKSTFIKMIIHEEKPNAGEIMVGKYRLSRMKSKEIPALRRTMGIVFQDFRLIRNMTVFENVAFAMHVLGASKRDIRKRVAYTLNIVGLGDKARNYPDELSGGEQQRVALARALVNNPTMILADEPTGNVDPNMSYEIVSLLNEINKRGTTIIMVTHEHHLVRDFGHRVIMIEDGAVVADNEIEPVIKSPADLQEHMSSLMPEAESGMFSEPAENHASMFTADPIENNIPDSELTGGQDAAPSEAKTDDSPNLFYGFDLNSDFKLADEEEKETNKEFENVSESFGDVLETLNKEADLNADPVDRSTLESMLFGNSELLSDDAPAVTEIEIPGSDAASGSDSAGQADDFQGKAGDRQ